jgi:hypothetical protein
VPSVDRAVGPVLSPLALVVTHVSNFCLHNLKMVLGLQLIAVGA